MANWLTKLLGDTSARELKQLQPLIAAATAFESTVEGLSDDQLRAKTAEFRTRLAEAGITTESDRPAYQSVLDTLLPEAFAVVREAAKRTLGQRHYDVQLIGGVVLHQGKIAEMRTGEGKTLVATLPLYLNALLGRGAHLVTVNDYLAKRDGMWMGQVFAALGMSTGIVNQQGASFRYTVARSKEQGARSNTETEEGEPLATSALLIADLDWPYLESCSRLEAYQCDVTYGTNNEFGFDYLRDHMAQDPSQLTVTRRGLHYAIVDEVDSILIDEARTPLIISAPAEESAELYRKFSQLAQSLKPVLDYSVDEKERSVAITDEGIRKMETALGLTNIYDAASVQLVYHMEEALRARALYHKDKEYVVKDGEVIIVDEFTGRMMPGRRYSEGLHQAIEAKEGVAVQRESDTLATITFQNLFRLYDKLAGMTGTAATEAEEFGKIYNLDVLEIPTHRDVARVDSQDLIYKTEAAKFNAIVEEVRQRSEAGQPVLLGTISIEKNQGLSRALKAAGIKHELLNAKQHEREAKIVANAGRPGAVTVATNMAGRGVDIVLGGKPPTVASGKEQTARSDPEWEQWERDHQTVLAAGGLAVIGTERHESRRIDNQLRGRAGRQGDPGYSQFFVSMEDELMRIFGGERLKGMMDRLGLPDNEAIGHSIVSKSIETAQRRVEGHNFDIRKHLVEYDDVMNRHREVLYKKRQRILLLDPTTDEWLYDELLELMEDGEKSTFVEKVKNLPAADLHNLERVLYLRSVDALWVQHLNTMTELRRGIGLRGYAQRDPLVEYKEQAYGLFQALKHEIEDQVIQLLLKLEIQAQTPQLQITEPQRQLTLQGADESLAGGGIIAAGIQDTVSAKAEQLEEKSQPETRRVIEPPTSYQEVSGNPQPPTPNQSPVKITVRSPFERMQQVESAVNGPVIGRNDPCYCGSGKKFKKCHGKHG